MVGHLHGRYSHDGHGNTVLMHIHTYSNLKLVPPYCKTFSYTTVSINHCLSSYTLDMTVLCTCVLYRNYIVEVVPLHCADGANTNDLDIRQCPFGPVLMGTFPCGIHVLVTKSPFNY